MDDHQPIISEIAILAKDDPKFTEKCLVLANDIQSNKYPILQLVQDLGPLLTNSTVDDREKERLNDHHQVVPAVIKGLTPLISSKNIPEGLSTQLISSLFQHVPCQQQQQHDRYNIYQFIKAMLDKRKEELKAMGLDAVYGVISAIDSERDPRNLLFLFKWLPNFLTTMELGQLTEEMFDVISCYFPVDFRPSVQEGGTVTRQDLADALCPCLCAIPSFAESCILLALEKFESELYVAKLDSLDLLITGCKNFPHDIYKQHSSTIWPLIQKEVFSSKDRDDKELENKCLDALISILRKLSIDTEFSKQITKDMIDTLKRNIEPNAILFIPSTKLIRNIAQASPQIAEIVFKEISPLLINMYTITTTPLHKAIILQYLVGITIIYLTLNSGLNSEGVENLEIVSNICLKAVIDTDAQIRAAGICSFSNLAPFVSPMFRNYFYDHLSVLIVLKQEVIVREAIIASLRKYGTLYDVEIQNILSNVRTNNGLESLELYLEAIGAVVCIPQLSSFSLSILVRNLFLNLDVSVIAARILKNRLDEEEVTISRHLNENENIVEKIVDYFIENINNLNGERFYDYLNCIAKILMIVLRYTEDIQEIIVSKELEKIQSVISHDLTIFILFGLLTSLKLYSNIVIDVNLLCDMVIETKSLYISSIGSQLIGNIVNKTVDENSLCNCLNCIESKCNSILSRNQQINNGINLVTCTTKALAVRGSPLVFPWANKLIDLSSNLLNAAKVFQTILDDGDDYLHPKSFCKRTVLYKQRFFSEISGYLVSNYEDGKEHYLVILGYLIRNVPQQILRLELKKIIRLILLCLGRCEEVEVLLAILTAINVVIESKDPIAEDYIQEFLKYYSKLATFDRSMKVRILALQGIQLYSRYPLYKLLPLKQDVLLTLSKCLDDKKRLVRKEAVEARSKWFLIDAPI
ncbi:putative DNA repair transcription protein met18 [Trypoxylus dichotomus]